MKDDCSGDEQTDVVDGADGEPNLDIEVGYSPSPAYDIPHRLYRQRKGRRIEHGL